MVIQGRQTPSLTFRDPVLGSSNLLSLPGQLSEQYWNNTKRLKNNNNNQNKTDLEVFCLVNLHVLPINGRAFQHVLSQMHEVSFIFLIWISVSAHIRIVGRRWSRELSSSCKREAWLSWYKLTCLSMIIFLSGTALRWCSDDSLSYEGLCRL